MSKPTSSPASASGPTRSARRAGQTLDLFGPAPVPASPSPLPGEPRASATTATSGPTGSSSSRSAALQSCLESRLRALMASGGSTLYVLTWKARVTPSGHRICARRASVRRTSDSACSSWPSPTVNDAKGSAYSYGNGDHSKPCLKLVGAARLAAWSTPRAEERQQYNSKPGDNYQALSLQVKGVMVLAGRATPCTRDHKSDRGQQSDEELYGTKGKPLPRQALQVSGVPRSGSLAKTAASGQLNPEHSRWLQGLPTEWASCAPTETRSAARSRRRSSGP